MPKIIIASGPVIVSDDKVLLDIQGDDTFWKFCGGKVKKDETLQQTAIRRAKEELGIDIEITNSEPFIFYTKKETADIIVIHFLAKSLNNIIPGDEVREWKWTDINNLGDNLAPSIVPTLRHFGFIK